MKCLKRLLRVAAVFLLVNLGLLEWLWPLPAAAHWPLLAALAAFYLYFHIRPRHAPGASRRLPQPLFCSHIAVREAKKCHIIAGYEK